MPAIKFNDSIKLYALVMVTVLLLSGTYGQIAASELKLRKPSTIKIEALQKDKAFNYSETPANDGFFDALVNQFYDWFNKNMPDADYENFWRYVFTMVVIFFAILIAWNVSGRKLQNLITKDLKPADFNESISNDQVNNFDFENLIDAAVTQGNYRLAIRLYYLHALKLLNDRHLIVWQPEKTNSTYLQELIEKELKRKFSELTHVFDNAWYGNKLLTFEHCERCKVIFSELLKQISKA